MKHAGCYHVLHQTTFVWTLGADEMNESGLVALEQSRATLSDEIAQRVKCALELMKEQGIAPSFYSVADAAQVARSTLYRRSDLRSLVEEARGSFGAQSNGYSAVAARLADLQLENTRLKAKMQFLQAENSALLRAAEPVEHAAVFEYEFITLGTTFVA